MQRRTLAAVAALALGATLGLASPAALAQNKTLRVVAHADVKILDPSFTTAYISRNFGYMVYDMPFGLDAKGQPKPQMVDKYTSSKDGKQWSFTLRPNLKFADGSPVRAADVVASMQRWTSKDSMGRAMTALSAAEWKAVDDKTFTLSLKEPFGMVLEAMSKPSGYPPVVMPERMAKLPTTTPIAEVMGSGPFMFKRDEWVPGNKVVFVRNPHYVPRTDAPNGLAGSKKPSFDRVEWLYIPDANSAVAALRKGEVDLIEQVPPDFINPLRADPNVKLLPSGSWQGFIVMNQLHPPFNNPKVRQAVLKAVDQDKFMAAMGYPKDLRVTNCATFFICGSRNETTAGAEPWRTPDVAKAKQLLAEAGYKGEKVVLLVPSDITYLNAEALMAAQTMRNIGMNVDMQTSDWATIGARRAKRDAPDKGGWNMYVTVAGSFDADSPVTNAYLSAACGTSLPGWPCDKPLDELRTAWLKETDAGKRKQLLDQFHARAFEALPYISAGQYSPAMAVRAEVKGAEKLWGGLPLVWNLDK
ncbi:ABC transporter substrate-binding protein [Ramlibacter tataouinensis]|uniref:ABC transporter substrate-binding protein n=1 Tax=Ramlibacter tataouinensis TaxID=94132 RepID=UPI0022F388F1|nr:ABC transporter substrate-binding protein [Ramlibacter tataouinensis]WBY03562.1 ABC transporter substrate-binding protein [Ramlibacter tataouinensis]